MSYRHRVLAVAAVLAFAGAADADETTFCNFYITSLPYTIAAQGHYCFDRNLSTAITSGAAINIASDYVLLDLNHFKLGGGAAGPGTTAVGIQSLGGHRDVTIRNGDIRGFSVGILLEGDRDMIVEHNELDGSTSKGIWVLGVSGTAIVRNNLVTNTGGSTDAYGIEASADSVFMRDNVVGNVSSAAGQIVGIALGDGRPSPPALVAERNLITLGEAAGLKYGVFFFNRGVARDNTVLGASSAADAFFPAPALIGQNYSNP